MNLSTDKADEVFDAFEAEYQNATEAERHGLTTTAGALHLHVARLHGLAQKAAADGDQASFYAAVMTGAALMEALMASLRA